MHEELQQMAWDAEDEGKDVYVARHAGTGIIEYIEIDGVETYNFDYVDEVRDAYYAEDAYNVADRNWRE